MIIESSFYKLPELLMGASFNIDGAVEATVKHLFATAVMMELIGRGTPRPQEHVTSEKSYPKPPYGTRALADLLVDLTGAIGRRMGEYGTREKNWIELKTCLGGMTKYSGTRRVGGILKDLVRLSLFPDEFQGQIRQNGRYFLFVTDQPFDECLPNLADRPWLADLLRVGSREVTFDLAHESSSTIRESLAPRGQSLFGRWSIGVHTFEPYDREMSPVFWGALVRIKAFELRTDAGAVTYGELDRSWSAADQEQLTLVRESFGTVLDQTAVEPSTTD